jgi:Ca2+-binding RTX toxin-like protein
VRSYEPLTTMGLTVLVASGVALAATGVGTPRDDTPRDDTLLGTNGPDQLDGRAGDDHIFSLRGRDTLHGSRDRTFF